MHRQQHHRRDAREPGNITPNRNYGPPTLRSCSPLGATAIQLLATVRACGRAGLEGMTVFHQAQEGEVGSSS